MKLSEQLKQQLLQVETSLEACQQILNNLNKQVKEEETKEWLENWSRWTD